MSVSMLDPLAPGPSSSSSKDHTTFRTLTRERQFRHPPSTKSDIPALDELVKPHIESFNALLEDDQGNKGLLALGVEEVGSKVVFDGKATEGMPWGNKISCGSLLSTTLPPYHLKPLRVFSRLTSLIVSVSAFR